MSWADLTSQPLNQKTQTESTTIQGLSRTSTVTDTLTDTEVNSFLTEYLSDVLDPPTLDKARKAFREFSNSQCTVLQVLERVRVWAKRITPTNPP